MRWMRQVHAPAALTAAGALSAFLVSIRHIGELATIVGWDEIGYWGVGAWLAGYDWSEIVSEFSGYYSYGYGILIALLLKLIRNPLWIYKAAVALNGLLVAGSFRLAVYAGKRLFRDLDERLVIVASFLSCMYGNTIFQASFAWSETLITFLFWLLLALFLAIGESGNRRLRSWALYLSLAAATAYLYAVHQRNLGIAIACILTVLCCSLKDKKRWKQALMFLLLAGLLFYIGYLVKGAAQAQVWRLGEDAAIMNDYSVAVPDSAKKFTSITGVRELGKSFVCRLFTWGCSTFLFSFLFFEHLLERLLACIKQRRLLLSGGELFCLLGVLGNIGVITITLSQQGTNQALLYGRYMDTIAGPVILIGLLRLITLAQDRKWRELCARCLIYLVLLYMMKLVVESVAINRDYFVPNCNVELYYWWSEEDKAYDLAGMVCAAFSVFVAAASAIKGSTRSRHSLLMLGILAIVYLSSRIRISDQVFEKTAADNAGYVELADACMRVREEGKAVWLYYDKENWRVTPCAGAIQLFLYDRSLRLAENTEEVRDGYLFLLKKDGAVDPALVSGRMECVADRELAALYRCTQ